MGTRHLTHVLMLKISEYSVSTVTFSVEFKTHILVNLQNFSGFHILSLALIFYSLLSCHIPLQTVIIFDVNKTYGRCTNNLNDA